MQKNKPSHQYYIPAFIFGLLICIYAATIGFKLINDPRPFVDWDESIYMEVGREMIKNGSVVPQWLNKPWLEKPPLVPFVYGLVALLPYRPEITTRIFSLLLSVCALILIYLWAKKTFHILKAPVKTAEWLALFVCVITAINPVFIKRTQEVNTDVWLLIGWLGYLLTYPRFWTSLFFLFIGVFSKSLLGFYPLVLTLANELYKYLRHENRNLKNTLILSGKQLAIMMIWYFIMIILYGTDFIEVHFVDHMLRRVTQSIESHFGKRTFYFDILVETYGWYLIMCGLSITVAVYRFAKDKLSNKLLYLLFFLPFFIFLNLTKTKIAWYIYPVVPGVAMLLAYPLTLLRNKYLIITMTIILSTAACYQGYFKNKILAVQYSSENPKYKVAVLARKECRSLHMLLDGGTREMFTTLEKLNLLISTSFVYGNNPAMIYYYGKPIKFYKNATDFKNQIRNLKSGECVTIENKEIGYVDELSKMKMVAKYDWQVLMRVN